MSYKLERHLIPFPSYGPLKVDNFSVWPDDKEMAIEKNST